MKKTQIYMNKLVYFALSVLELSEISMYEFWCVYAKPKYSEKAKLCYMDTDSFTVYTKTDDIYKYIAGDIETRFDISNHELDGPLLKGKYKKVAGLRKVELGEKIMKEFVALRAKTYSYLIDDGREDSKAKGTKKCVIKRKLKFENYKSCLEGIQLENNISHLEKLEINVDSL